MNHSNSAQKVDRGRALCFKEESAVPRAAPAAGKPYNAPRRNMIRFPCHCNHRFELDDEQAGGVVQCPRCGRLNDVPARDDLPSIQQDGTYSLELAPAEPDAEPDRRLRELQRVFTRSHVDEEGNEIDLRGAAGDDEESEEDEIPLKPREPASTGAASSDRTPKYDPISGELILPVELREDPPVSLATVPGTGSQRAAAEPPKLSYASGQTAAPRTGSIPTWLLSGVNVVVMFFIFAMHLLAAFSMWMLGLVLSMVGIGAHWVVFPFSALIIAHYGNTIDDIGTEGRDELPAPLRNISWSDDLWGPFIKTMFAWLVCYGPAALVLTYVEPGPPKLPLLAAAWIAGSFFFPAVLMTALCGVTIENLRPDRVIGVIGTCGGGYLRSCAIILPLMPLYVWLVLGWSPFEELLAAFPRLIWLSHPAVWLPLTAAGVYVAHLFCWHLALLYREHFEQFPWVGMRYIKPQDPDVPRRPRRHAPRVDPNVRLEELRDAERQQRAASMRDRI